MLKLLWWSLRDYCARKWWLYCAVVIALLFAAAVPAETGYLGQFAQIVCSLIGALFFVYGMLQAVTASANWVGSPSVLFELSLPASPAKLLGAKMLLSALIGLSTLVLARLLGAILDKYAGSILSFGGPKTIALYLFATVILSSIIQFSAIAAKSARSVSSPLVGVGILVGIVVLLGALIVLLNTLTGGVQYVVHTHFNIEVLPADGDRAIGDLIFFGVLCVAGAGCFVGSCALLKNKFEPRN